MGVVVLASAIPAAIGAAHGHRGAGQAEGVES